MIDREADADSCTNAFQRGYMPMELFQAYIIGIAFFTTFLIAIPAMWLEEHEFKGISFFLFGVGLISGLYCIFAGLYLAGTWEDPISNVDPEMIGKMSGRARGRGGIIILVVRFWPYVLIASGGYFVFHYVRIFMHKLRH
jgi:hypothetical protein